MDAIKARVPALVLVLFGAYLTVAFGSALLGIRSPETPWLASLFLMLMAVAILALSGAVALDPGPIGLRGALAGAALAWLVILIGLAAIWTAVRPIADAPVLLLLVVADAAALVGLAATTTGAPSEEDALDRLGGIVLFAMAIIGATAAAVVAISIADALLRTVVGGRPLDRLPWGAFAAVLVIPPVMFGLASYLSHRAAAGTFYAQAAANRRNSLLLLVALIGVAAATAEIIAISLTRDPVPALWAAAAAIIVGLGAVVAADRLGTSMVLDSAGAKRAQPKRDSTLLDVVRELAVAADIPVPATYVVEDGSMNAFATGRDPQHAALAVTRGLLETMDREELQGVVAHEMGHIRNLDTRYALYIAVFVGLVALVTDGFLRIIVEAWRRGAFLWRGSGKGAAGALATGILVGIFLLVVAVLLRVFAPLFAALVQAATSREREFLADATSVELTRNPRALERALVELEPDTDVLEAANRGTQHMWFRNPIRAGDDGPIGLFATHPTLAARIDRLRKLEGLDPSEPSQERTSADPT